VHAVARLLARWPIALAAIVAFAAAVLVPALGDFGLYDPQERVVADKSAPRRIGKVADLDAMIRPTVQLAAQPAPKPQPSPQLAQPPRPPPPKQSDSCAKVPPPDAAARSLGARAAGWGRDAIDDSDAGRRLPFALLGVLCVVAAAGTALRLAGTRAALATALVLASMPLFVLQSRSLTSEIGTATGGAMIVYGFVALACFRPTRWAPFDVATALASLAGGLAIGFYGGGALLGVAVPVGAIAAAGGLGAYAIAAVVRAARRRPPSEVAIAEHVVTLVATALAIATIGVLVYQLYSLEEPFPGAMPPQRAALGKAIVTSDCWSWALGALWRHEDDVRFAYDSMFEQIAYGTFPWGVVAPIALAALISRDDRGRRKLGAIALAWAAGAWLASEAFQRRVGFNLYAGFPALALALGVWLDDLLARRVRLAAGAAMLVGLFFLLAAVDLGKDMQTFSERISSLVVGSDGIQYPPMARIAFLPAKLWLLVIGGALGLAFALAVYPWRRPSRIARGATVACLGVTAMLPAFWAFAWQPALATHLSSRVLFDTYAELAGRDDALAIMGDLGDAPHDYAPDVVPELVATHEQVVAALKRDKQRVFAIAPLSERCTIHRDMGKQPYFVVEDRNVRSLLFSNRVDGTDDKNPLRDKVLHEEPKRIAHRPPKKVVFDSRIELLGWDIPAEVSRGGKFEITTYYKVLQPVGVQWTVLFHFDGALRFNGDHPPLDNICSTATWMPGDYIVDTYTVVAGGGTVPSGQYDVWTGFFTGTNPNWRNMPVSEAPPDMRDTTDRVKITTITLD
jgi:hypothetical protein